MNILIIDSSDIELCTIKEVAQSPNRWVVLETTFEHMLNIEERGKFNLADVLVLNLTSIENGIFETVQLLKYFDQHQPLVALHIYRQVEFVMPLLQKGVDAYIPVEFVNAELVDAIKAVKAGYPFESRHLVEG
ncbi:MAG TPA: hypothetical protein VJ964_01515 [Balneolaceae bacterium]|nr:hypothetical protein [Balneolaceae bacterium]